MKTDHSYFSSNDVLDNIQHNFETVISILSVQRIGVWEYDITSSTMLYLNDFQKIFNLEEIGITSSQLVKFEDYIHPEDIAAFKEKFLKASDAVKQKSVARYRILSPTGKQMWMEDHFAISKSNEGAEKIIGYTLNIDKQVEREEQIKRLEIRYKSIIEALPGFIFVFDKKFILREVFMPESMQLFHSAKELVGMSGSEIYTPEVSELFISTINKCLEDGVLREIEYPVYLKELSFYYQARIVPYGDDMALALIQDIGDRVKRIEEQVETRKREETNIMKSAFLANMSHEIRTPLNAIVGFSEILAADDYNENKEEFIDIIRANSELLLQLINDILDLSRIESGKIEVVFHEVDINSMLKEVSEVYQIKMKPEVELQLVMPKEKVLTYTDANRVKQVLYNFLSNSVKHTKKGSITIGLKIEDNDSLTFSVTDTGVGIEKEKLSFLFGRFEKLNNYAQGTGLGLSISKNLVEYMGGEIGVTSEFGKGSTFYFTLPRRDSKEKAEAAIPELSLRKKKANPASSDQKKILIIEPVDADFRTIQATLRKDYLLFRATTTDETRSLYMTEAPDLILINISDSSINSIDIIKAIRTASSFIPIISLTTHGNYIDQEFAIKAGSNDAVLKPFASSRLQDAIVAYI